MRAKASVSRVYPDAPHGFLNDTMPGRYRAAQSDAAWNQITSFLKSVFAGEWKKDRATWRFEAESSVNYDFTHDETLGIARAALGIATHLKF